VVAARHTGDDCEEIGSGDKQWGLGDYVIGVWKRNDVMNETLNRSSLSVTQRRYVLGYNGVP